MCCNWRVLLVVGFAAVLTGCTGPWHQSYISTVPESINFEAVNKAQVRVVSWDRFEQAFHTIEQYADEHDLAPEDFGPQDIRVVNTAIFKALRLKDPPEQMAIIGHTSFTHTAQLDPRSGDLQSLAQDQGAHYAIAAMKYLGSKRTIESLPISSTTYTTVTHKVEDENGKTEKHTDTAASRTTTWVPRTVVRDYWAHRAVLIRRINESERRMLETK